MIAENLASAQENFLHGEKCNNFITAIVTYLSGLKRGLGKKKITINNFNEMISDTSEPNMHLRNVPVENPETFQAGLWNTIKTVFDGKCERF